MVENLLEFNILLDFITRGGVSNMGPSQGKLLLQYLKTDKTALKVMKFDLNLNKMLYGLTSYSFYSFR